MQIFKDRNETVRAYEYIEELEERIERIKKFMSYKK